MIPQDIIDTIKESEKITILPHISADGDAIGSSLALALALKKANKEIKLYTEEKMPQVYSFLPNTKLISIYNEDVYNSELYESSNQDLVIALDTGDVERLGNRVKILNRAKYKINIDHHPTNTYFAQMNYVLPKASSTGEIVYHLINSLGIEIDVNIATCLYVAILTDTGGFKYSNTTSDTHFIVSKLVDYGIDTNSIAFRIFDSMSQGKLRLIGSAINTLELYESNKIAILSITEKMLKDSGALEEDSEGIIYYGRNLMGVELTALLKEKSDCETKVSLRSNEYIDVASIAKAHSGGGHKRAAGCTIKANILDAKEIILSDLKKAISEYSNKKLKSTHKVNGIINVLKPPGMTSFDVVAYIRGILKSKKVGHAGTLDPAAAGVLIVCVGNATKVIEHIMDMEKTYRAELTLGVSTDTQDSFGKIISTNEVHIDKERIIEVIMSFVGELEQIPPMFSALKVGGKRLYEIARQGKVIERKARKIFIDSIDIINITETKIIFDVTCSKGTYIRTLCSDIGDTLGCGGHMSFLIRKKTGCFEIDHSITLENITKKVNLEDLSDIIIPTEKAFREFDDIYLNDINEKKFRNGNFIDLNKDFDKNKVIYSVGKIFKIFDNNQHFMGLGEIINKEGNDFIKPKKMFC